MPADSVDLDQIRTNVDAMASDLDLSQPGTIRDTMPATPSLTDQRRRRRPGPRNNVMVLTLVEREGMVFWEVGSPARPELRRSRRAPSFLGRPLVRKETPILGSNEIVGYLERLDSKLTPYCGLRTWNGQALVPCMQVAQSGKVLLFIHGTFSNTDHLLTEIKEAPNGAKFLSDALTQLGYSQILTFDHPTLSVSPMLNAMDLRNGLGASQADVDIICHSRGGLVSRWWIEVFDPLFSRKKRAVFVGSPLTGTSLAAPERLRAGLKLLSTYATFLGNAAMAAPLLNAPAALLRIFASLTSAAAGVPLIDAGVAMIPGLNGQSRVENAIELKRLNAQCGNCPTNYYFVSSNFDPEKVGWNVLKWVRGVGIRTLNTVADSFVFPGDNDLVVDTLAMTEPWSNGIGALNSLKFGASAGVHHTNYFRNRDTIDFITKSLV